MKMMMMMMLSKSGVALALLALLRYLQLLISNTALALGVSKFRNYWNKKKGELPSYVLYVPIGFLFVNLMVQQSLAMFADLYCYDSRYAWVAFAAAAFFHLLGAVFSYSVIGSSLQRLNLVIALLLVGLAGIRITFGHDTRIPAFLLCQLLIQVPRIIDP